MFGIKFTFDSVKSFVLQDAFSNNPLYYYPVVKKILLEKRFEQLLNSFSVECAKMAVIAEGPVKKLNQCTQCTHTNILGFINSWE